MSAFEEPPTRAKIVTDELRRMIVTGEITPGTRLRQLDIAERFGFSTTPVREAFASLAREGFVRQDAHRGVEVFRPTKRDIAENYEIRLSLEPLAAQIAATEITDEQLANVDRLHQDMLRPVEWRLGTELNRRFHFAIYAAADRPMLFEIIERLRRSADAYVQLLSGATDRYRDAVKTEHQAIVDALAARDPDAARAAMVAHLDHNRTEIDRQIDERDTEPAKADARASD